MGKYLMCKTHIQTSRVTNSIDYEKIKMTKYGGTRFPPNSDDKEYI